jgi:hypothetical protein
MAMSRMPRCVSSPAVARPRLPVAPVRTMTGESGAVSGMSFTLIDLILPKLAAAAALSRSTLAGRDAIRGASGKEEGDDGGQNEPRYRHGARHRSHH